MNLITVIPLTRSKVAETLSYFTASDIPLGAIVSVPLRSKTIHAIVTEVQPAVDAKSAIRSAAFAFRKLGSVRAKGFFPPSFMETCKNLADHYAATTGAVMKALTPEILLENANKITAPKISLHTATDETYAVQGDDDDRMGSWRSLIRQEFARKKSIAFYVPTIEDARNMCAGLTKGIEGYMFVLHGALPKKELLDTWKAIADMEHPIAIVATGSFALLPRSDIETIVIERENGRGWISPRAPYADMRRALEAYGRANKQTVYLADSMLRLETLHRLDQNEISQGSPFKWRSVSTARDTLIDMTVKKDQSPLEKTVREEAAPEEAEAIPGAKKKFRVLSPELKKLIALNREESTHLFIFTVRRGLATMTVCDDCETVVSCKECSSPVVLHTSRETGRNFFMCHACGARRSADEMCVTCGGWRLTPLGVGIDRVEEEIRMEFPDADIFKIDADTTKTDKQIATAVANWKARPGSILLGTELALLHLKDKIEHTAVASLDSLFALPDFRVPEKIMYLLVRLRTLTTRSILIQTRRPEEKIFEYGLKGNLSDFCRGALEERKAFGYPPWKTLIKLTIEGKKEPIAKLMAEIQKIVEPYEVDIFPAFTATVRGSSVIHGLIQVEPKLWPDPSLVLKLRTLPPEVSIKVDPESLL